MSTPYRLVGVSLDTEITSVLLPTKSVNVSPGIQEMVSNVASSVYDNFTAISQLDLSISFTTDDLSTIFDTIDIIEGMSLSSTNGVSVWFSKSLSQGTGTPTRFHQLTDSIRLRMVSGLGYVSSFSGSGNNPIEANVEFHGAWLDGNYPMIIETGTAPDALPCVDDVYVVGYFEGVPVDSISYESGVDLLKYYTGGLHYPSFVGYNSITPTFNVSASDPALLDEVKDPITNEPFKPIVNGSIELRRVKKNGTRYPISASEHARIDIFDAMVRMESAEGGMGSPGTFNINIKPVLPCGASNSIFDVTTGVTIGGYGA